MSASSEFMATLARLSEARGQALAQGIQNAANARAQAQANSAQIWGQAINQLGQIPQQYQQQQLQQQEMKLRTQQQALQTRVTQAQLDAMNRAQDSQQKAQALLSQTLKQNPDGTQTIDPQAMLQMMNANGVLLDHQKEVLGFIDDANKTIVNHQTNSLNASGDLANVILSRLKPGEQPDPLVFNATVGLAQANKWFDPQVGTQLLQAGAQTDDLRGMLERIRDLAPKYAPEVGEGAAGNVTYNKRTGQPIATLGAKPPTTVFQGYYDQTDPSLPPEERSRQATTMMEAHQAATAPPIKQIWVERNGQVIPIPEGTAKPGDKLATQMTPYQQQSLDLRRQAEARLEKEQPGNVTPFGDANIPDVQSGQRNEAYLKTLDPSQASIVKALTEGRQPFPTGAALRNQYWQQMVQSVMKYDPSFDEAQANFNARNKTRVAFTSGKEAANINALNTAIGHLAVLSDLGDALNTGNVQRWNELKNWFKQELGSPSVNNYNIARKFVADELTRVWRQTGGAEKDIQETMANFDPHNSPSQMHGAGATIGHMLDSKIEQLNEQYKQGMGVDKINILTPDSVKVLQGLEDRAAGKKTGILTPEGLGIPGLQLPTAPSPVTSPPVGGGGPSGLNLKRGDPPPAGVKPIPGQTDIRPGGTLRFGDGNTYRFTGFVNGQPHYEFLGGPGEQQQKKTVTVDGTTFTVR